MIIRQMKINNMEVIGKEFAYDGCHKIYILEDEQDKKEAMEYEYEIYGIEEIKKKYNESCSFKFINNWKSDKRYVLQFEDAIFEKEIDKEL